MQTQSITSGHRRQLATIHASVGVGSCTIVGADLAQIRLASTYAGFPLHGTRVALAVNFRRALAARLAGAAQQSGTRKGARALTLKSAHLNTSTSNIELARTSAHGDGVLFAARHATVRDTRLAPIVAANDALQSALALATLVHVRDTRTAANTLGSTIATLLALTHLLGGNKGFHGEAAHTLAETVTRRNGRATTSNLAGTGLGQCVATDTSLLVKCDTQRHSSRDFGAKTTKRGSAALGRRFGSVARSHDTAFGFAASRIHMAARVLALSRRDNSATALAVEAVRLGGTGTDRFALIQSGERATGCGTRGCILGHALGVTLIQLRKVNALLRALLANGSVTGALTGLDGSLYTLAFTFLHSGVLARRFRLVKSECGTAGIAL